MHGVGFPNFICCCFFLSSEESRVSADCAAAIHGVCSETSGLQDRQTILGGDTLSLEPVELNANFTSGQEGRIKPFVIGCLTLWNETLQYQTLIRSHAVLCAQALAEALRSAGCAEVWIAGYALRSMLVKSEKNHVAFLNRALFPKILRYGSKMSLEVFIPLAEKGAFIIDESHPLELDISRNTRTPGMIPLFSLKGDRATQQRRTQQTGAKH